MIHRSVILTYNLPNDTKICMITRQTKDKREKEREREREADRHKEKQMKTITGTRYKTKYLPSTTTYIEYYVIEVLHTKFYCAVSLHLYIKFPLNLK